MKRSRLIEDISDNWTLEAIQDVCFVNPGKPSKDALPEDASVTFVPMPAVDAESGTISAPDEKAFREGITMLKVVSHKQNANKDSWDIEPTANI